MLRHVTACALSNRPLSVVEVKKSMYRFYLTNVGLVKPDAETPWHMYDLHEKNLDHIYRGWKTWIAENYSKEWHLKRRNLHVRAGEQAAYCTPKAVHSFFDTLEALLTEVGLYPDGCLNALALKCVWHCDEKGMESLPNGNLKQQRVVAPKCCGKNTTSVAESSFGHITLLPFLSLGALDSFDFSCECPPTV